MNPIILAIVGSGVLSTLMLIINEWVRRRRDDKNSKKDSLKQRQIDIYNVLVSNLDFMYEGIQLTNNMKIIKRDNFLKAYRLLYLYATDDVVNNVNKMIDTLIAEPTVDDKITIKRKKTIGKVLLSMRNKNYPKTNIGSENFRYIS